MLPHKLYLKDGGQFDQKSAHQTFFTRSLWKLYKTIELNTAKILMLFSMYFKANFWMFFDLLLIAFFSLLNDIFWQYLIKDKISIHEFFSHSYNRNRPSKFSANVGVSNPGQSSKLAFYAKISYFSQKIWQFIKKMKIPVCEFFSISTTRLDL